MRSLHHITWERLENEAAVTCRSLTQTDPGQAVVPFAYGEAAANVLTNPVLDPYGKIPEFKCAAVKVEATAPA